MKEHRPDRARVHRGHVFHVAGSPRLDEAASALVSIPDGALVVGEDGTIAWCGEYADLPAEHDALPVHDVRPGFLLPGFVDTHVHFPQTFSVDAYGGGQLLEWLDRAIFPAEARLADPGFAQLVASAFCDRRIAAGTTAAMVFGSAFPAAQDALYTETRRRGLRIVSGRGIQTRGPESAAPLITGEDEAIEAVRAEIDAWHAVDTGDPATARIQVAVVPRFSLSVTPETFRNLGELYDDVRERGVYFHSHISENDRPGDGEIDATKALYGCERYLDTYDGRFLPGSQVGGSSLLGRRSILAHAVHCTDGELERMAETGTSIAHCPTSQLFLGSGTMPWRRTTASGVTVGIGTDVGAGDEWSIARVLGDTYKVHISEPGDAGVSLDPAQLLFSGTLAGARALDMEARFGNFDAGKDADFLVVDPRRWQPLSDALDYGIRSDAAELARDQLLFTVLTVMREPAIAEVYVGGGRID
ncbi:guanine deaminase [Rhodococcus rhodnii]|uniref:Guanine deaminase n=2 Tax=Rhodococcus rhodnii TaxID=38312 RepID=R7WNB4_9NOCA|nr:guanine deaminase [Rhodococcus rhodnii]EOM76783.1 guanine deaminase [Rhodococcus rhodnii LMG 5362]TXG90038.1 guanine deaminase [Rhodococcus rhodnii]